MCDWKMSHWYMYSNICLDIICVGSEWGFYLDRLSLRVYVQKSQKWTDNQYREESIVPLTKACWRQFLPHNSLTELPVSLSCSLYFTNPRSWWDSYIKLSHLDLNPLLHTNQWASSSRPTCKKQNQTLIKKKKRAASSEKELSFHPYTCCMYRVCLL